MVWALLSFIGVSIALGVAVAVLAAALRGRKDEIIELKKQLMANSVSADLASKTFASDKDRLEHVITNLKAEISKLEGDLDACHDPAVVRDRLRNLLSGS